MRTIRILMFPNPLSLDDRVSGIHTVIRAYKRVFPDYGMEFVHPDAECDVVITHAGMASAYADISMLHGIYFTAEYKASNNEWRANSHVVRAARRARFVTVPSEWVAETIRREFRREPVIIPHGVFADEWEHSYEPVKETVLWGKNRDYDACDPTDLAVIAKRMPDFNFVTTFYPSKLAPNNVSVIGVQPPERMKVFIQKSDVVISTVNETWGIMYAEAMASGTPVVTANWGHVPTLVPHGVAGYTYNRHDASDAVRGIRWSSEHRETLGANARKLASELRWQEAGERVRVLAERVVWERGRGLI